MNPAAGSRLQRVLVSGAESAVRQAVTDCLAELDVREATDAVTTAALAVATNPDVVVLDATHGEAAAATIDRLRKDFRTSFVPVIFVVERAPTESPLRELIAG